MNVLPKQTDFDVRLSLLGPVEMYVEQQQVPITAYKQRAVLALLALTPRTHVSASRIIDLLWGEDAPVSVRKNLQVLIGRLRDAIEPDRPRGDGGRFIISRDDGYLLDLPDEAFASRRFMMLCTRARTRLESDPEAALEQVNEALALWRGDPLGDLADEPWARAFVARQQEARVAALELRLEGMLMTARVSEAIAELTSLMDAHPYRETLIALQMRALHGAGRPFEALELYRCFRQRLSDELGIEVSDELRSLETAILQRDPGLTLPSRRVGGAADE